MKINPDLALANTGNTDSSASTLLRYPFSRCPPTLKNRVRILYTQHSLLPPRPPRPPQPLQPSTASTALYSPIQPLFFPSTPSLPSAPPTSTALYSLYSPIQPLFFPSTPSTPSTPSDSFDSLLRALYILYSPLQPLNPTLTSRFTKRAVYRSIDMHCLSSMAYSGSTTHSVCIN